MSHGKPASTCPCCMQNTSLFIPGNFEIEVHSERLADFGQALVGLCGIVSVDLIQGKIVLETDIDNEADYFNRLQDIRNDLSYDFSDATIEYKVH